VSYPMRARRRGAADDPARAWPSLWDGGGRAPLLQRPERPIPQNQGIAGSGLRQLHRSDADVVVAGGMHLENLTLEPRCATLDQGDAVRSDPMWDLSPFRVDCRRASREALGDELLVAREHADIELACFDHSQPGHAAVLEADQDERRVGGN